MTLDLVQKGKERYTLGVKIKTTSWGVEAEREKDVNSDTPGFWFEELNVPFLRDKRTER